MTSRCRTAPLAARVQSPCARAGPATPLLAPPPAALPARPPQPSCLPQPWHTRRCRQRRCCRSRCRYLHWCRAAPQAAAGPQKAGRCQRRWYHACCNCRRRHRCRYCLHRRGYYRCCRCHRCRRCCHWQTHYAGGGRLVVHCHGQVAPPLPLLSPTGRRCYHRGPGMACRCPPYRAGHLLLVSWARRLTPAAAVVGGLPSGVPAPVRFAAPCVPRRLACEW